MRVFLPFTAIICSIIPPYCVTMQTRSSRASVLYTANISGAKNKRARRFQGNRPKMRHKFIRRSKKRRVMLKLPSALLVCVFVFQTKLAKICVILCGKRCTMRQRCAQQCVKKERIISMGRGALFKQKTMSE
jgi:hypothetical protein